VLRALREGKGEDYIRSLQALEQGLARRDPGHQGPAGLGQRGLRFARGYRVHYEDVIKDLGQEQLAALGLTISFDLQDPRVSEAIPSAC
jgi:hypothetical protein